MTPEPQFTTNCPECGNVDLAVDQLWLVVPNVGNAHYDFLCPDCCSHVQHDATEEAIELLGSLVAVEELHIPAEALEPHAGDALTLDDLIDFMLELDCFDAAAKTPEPASPH